jgi:hypothetical protein
VTKKTFGATFDLVEVETMPGSKRGRHALRAWSVLVGFAATHRVCTYKELGEILGHNAWRLGNNVLAGVAYFCKLHKLPPLTCIVQRRDWAKAGKGLPEWAHDSSRVFEVFDEPWWSYKPPTPAEFDAAIAEAIKQGF